MDKSIKQFQAEVMEWTDHNFPGDLGTDVVLGTSEEVSELVEAVLLLIASTGKLSRASLKLAQGIRGTPEEWRAEIEKEAGDVFIKLCHVATKYWFDLHDAINKRWEDVRQRDFVSNPKGHGLPYDYDTEGLGGT
jgi:NTP pyrophosphatase (non-canonical NTP hydrolase)